MKKIFIWIIVILGIIAAVLASYAFYSATGVVVEKKPAIYLYPEQDSMINVQLDINGKIIKSIPNYENQWSVYATTESIIDNKYDYLFYEADLRALTLPDGGWVTDNIEEWFNIYLPKLGLNEKESSQFKEYWLNELPESNYYEIRLLSDDFLKENMNLIIEPKPDTLIRVNFYFKPIAKITNLPTPPIVTPIRSGFTVVEWGGILEKE